MERRILTADPRRIAAAEAEIVDVALKLRIRIVAIAGLALGKGAAHITSMMRPRVMGPRSVLRFQAVTAAAVFREPRRGDHGEQNKHRTQHFHVRQDLLRLPAFVGFRHPDGSGPA